MLRILLVLLLMSTPAWAVVQWRNGSGANTLLGSSNAADIDTNTYNNIVSPLDSLLANYREGFSVNYSSASQLSVSSGSITVSNSDGSVRLMLKNSNSTTVSFTDIDTGVEASGTTYYIYAIAASASSTSATFKVSASSTSPSGITYYKRLGYFTNNSSSDIDASSITNDNSYNGVEKNNNTVYLKNNTNLGGFTISNGYIGRTTTGSSTVSNGATTYVPSGCYMIGQTRDPDGSAGNLQYACP